MGVPLKNNLKTSARNDRRICYRPCRSNDLQITRQPEPWSNVKVVKHFDLMLDAQGPPPERQQVDVVLENLAKVGVRVCDAELVALPALE